MKRVTWLDASRGLAILLLIAMHYVGALESRQFISKEALDVFYGILRMATPFFMFTFGLAFFITASKKISRSNLRDYYVNNVFKRMLYILVGREVIVIILSFRYPEMAENLWSILLFQEFSKGGEILIFYFFAFLIAPLNVVFIQRAKLTYYVAFWIAVYAVSYYIGSIYVTSNSNNVLRFLFYDVYAFFPFLIVVAAAMLIAKVYIQSNAQEQFVKNGIAFGVIMCFSGFGILHLISIEVWHALAQATFKKPPHLGYMLFYLGEVFIVVGAVAMLSRFLPKIVISPLSLLGRNTLVSYVLHYSFFASVPIAAFAGGGALYEVLFLLLICGLCYTGIFIWDAHKTRQKQKKPAT